MSGTQGLAKFLGCGSCLVPFVMIIYAVANIQVFTEVPNFSGCSSKDFTSAKSLTECTDIQGSDYQCSLTYFQPVKQGYVGCMESDLCNTKITVDDITDKDIRDLAKGLITAAGYSEDTGFNVWCGWKAEIFGAIGINPNLLVASGIVSVISTFLCCYLCAYQPKPRQVAIQNQAQYIPVQQQYQQLNNSAHQSNQQPQYQPNNQLTQAELENKRLQQELENHGLQQEINSLRSSGSKDNYPQDQFK